MSAMIHLVLLCFVLGAFGEKCKQKCDDITNPECLIPDYCCDTYAELDEGAPCHISKLEAKDSISVKSSCCGQGFGDPSRALMFEDKCEKRTVNDMVCRKATGGFDIRKAAWDEKKKSCPSHCTTSFDLLKGANEYSLDNDKVKLLTSWANNVQVENSCQAYQCGYADRSTTENSWNLVASTCLCMKKTSLDKLDSEIPQKWNRCNGNDSLIANRILCGECGDNLQPLKFDNTEFSISGDSVTIDAFDWENPDEKINYKSKANYCFGPAWTEDGVDDIVKMKLFYCRSGVMYCDNPPTPPPGPCGVACIVGITVGAVIAVAVAVAVAIYFKLRPNPNPNPGPNHGRSNK